MFRKIVIFLIFASMLGAIVYGLYTYAVVALFDRESPQVTYFCLVEKPKQERGFSVYFDHINPDKYDRLIAIYKDRKQPIPWHMFYDDIKDNAVYVLTLDHREESKKNKSK